MDLNVQVSHREPVQSRAVEVVERKGLGHPDTICDALAEQISVRLCQYYLERFGAILHHNVDKLLLCGGASRPRFGGGEVVAPVEIFIAGRATSEYQGERVPIDDIAISACRDWLGRHVPGLQPRHVKLVSKIRPGSADLTRLFARGQAATPLSNDSSCGAGFAPFTDLERVVLGVERALNSPETKREAPALGTDIKVLGVRRGSRIHLTIGCALIDRFVANLDAYAAAKQLARSLAVRAAQRLTQLEVDATVNAADDLERGELFLTVTGTSAEAGDDGEVGRGNRTSGLITPYRPMTLEAAAGKNPFSHVGKLYNLSAQRIAAKIAERLTGALEVSCVLASQIGRPIDDPLLVDVELVVQPGQRVEQTDAAIQAVVRGELSRLPELRALLLAGQVNVY